MKMKTRLALTMFTILGVSQVYAFDQEDCVSISEEGNIIFPNVVPADIMVGLLTIILKSK